MTKLSLLSLALVAACGGGGNNNTNVDANLTGQHDAPTTHDDGPTTTDGSTTPDAHPTTDGGNTTTDGGNTTTDGGNTTTDGGTMTNDGGTMTNDGGTMAVCTSPVALGAQDIEQDDAANGYIAWGALVATDLGDGAGANGAVINFEFYDDGMTDLTMATDLATGDQANYSTCVACVTVSTFDATGTAVRAYFQSGGTLQLTTDPFTGEKMVGSITNLALDEVTIDSSNNYMSTVVSGGKCLTLGNVTLNHDQYPNAYTCAKATYNDGANCNCMCGAHDPDCDITGAPVVGCTTGQICDATTDMCADACTVAATLGTPTLTSPQAIYDTTYDVTAYDGALNADATPDILDIELWNGSGVFAAGVVPGTYQLTGAELDYSTCGACVQLWGNYDATNGPKQYYMAKTGTLKLTSTTGTITGTLTNATFGSVVFDADTGAQSPDGNNCNSALTSASFTSPITTQTSIHKTSNVRVHIMQGPKPVHSHKAKR